jgi:hypothetical protein
MLEHAAVLTQRATSTRRPIQCRPEIITLTLLRATGMQPDAHPQPARILPNLRLEPELTRDCRPHAASAVSNTACSPSPVVLITCPPDASTASRKIA